MRRSFIITILLACIACLTGLAQNPPLANEAAKLCQDKQYDAAKKKIAMAVQSPVESGDPFTWYVNGFIYKEYYKQYESGNRNSPSRETAVESFMKSLSLDKTNQHTAMTKTGLKFLATTYYNDALLRTREFDLTTEKEPEAFYNKFRKLMHTVEPGSSLNTYDKEYNKNMGQRYFALWQLDLDNSDLPERAATCYSEVIRMDSTDSDAFYNVAVVYYNRAVFKYRKIGPETDIFDLILIQQDCADLIKNKALPSMQKAYKLAPERGDIVRGLMFIHRALEHENDVEYFKKEIERLIDEGKIKEPDK